MTWPAAGFRLRQCPAGVRGVLAAFLVLAAAGYAADLATTYCRPTTDGSWIPDTTRLRNEFAGRPERPVSMVERVLETIDGPFNGTGTMRPAFTTRSEGWDALTRSLAGADREKLAAEREGERLALLAWVRTGADRAAYDRDEYDAGAGLAGQPVTPDLSPGPGRVRIRSLVERRCVTCHSDGGREDRARLKPFDTYDRLRYAVSVAPDPQVTRSALARRTATRLPLVALVLAAAGVLFGFAAVPGPVRRIGAPLPLVAFGLAVACTWLARWDASFVWGIVLGELVAAVGFAIHVAVVLRELVGGGCEPGPGGVECERPIPTGR